MSTQSSFGRSGSTTKSVRNLAGPRFRTIPRLEGLEDRTAPAVITPFTPRFQANDTGDIELIGNTLMTAPASDSDATDAQNGGNFNNNDFDMVFVDVDNDPTTFNSSTATLTLPNGAAVLFAGLYWGGDSDNSARNQVLFATPASGGYQGITGTIIGSGNDDYHAFGDVTALVQAAGNGVYATANVQADEGNDLHAGWGLVVVYRAPGLPARNLTVFDGFVDQGSGDPPTSIEIAGFQTPPAGPVNATIGVIAYEGDNAFPGDSMSLDGVPLSNAVNQSDNFFNSTISSLGAHFTNKNPNYVNQLGFDIDTIAAMDILGNNETTASIELTTQQDAYFPSVITTAIDLFSPTIQPLKEFTDLNGGDVRPGDVIEYTITLPNTGQDAAANLVFNDAIPANSTYVPGSLQVVAGANAGAKTDGAGDDQAEFDAVGNQVVYRLGIGANATAGGVLGIGETTTISFRVTINPAAPSGTVVTNQGSANFTGQETGFPLTADSNEVSVTIESQADLALTKTVSNPTPGVGETIRFTLILSNLGPDTATGVFVTDRLPSGLTFVSANASQGTINLSTATWDVGTLLSGQTEQVVIEAIVNSLTPGINVAAVTSETPDPNLRNNIAAAIQFPASADLNLVKTVSNPTPNVGDTITYTLTLTNNGPSGATEVQVSDPLPPGLTFQSATPSQGTYDPVSGIWTVGTLANGATATLTITATVVAVRPQRNTAVASGNEFDPDITNNNDSAITVPQLADLAALKTVDNAAPNVGDTVTFTITVANNGLSTATNVIVQDLLPAGLAFVSATPSQGTYDNITGVWTVGTLARGATATLTIQAMVTSPNPATNVATVDGDQFDPNLANNTANAALAPPLADLSLVKTVSNATPNVGDTITFTLTLTNNGPDTATGVVVADPLPAGLVFLSATPSQGTYDPGTGVWTVGTMANGAIVTLTITMRVDNEESTQNVAVASGNEFDLNPGNNGGVVVVTPQVADLGVVKTVSNATPNVGDVVTFTVQVTNNGPGGATGVTVQDLVPPGFSVVSATVSQGTVDPGTGVWTVGDLANGATATLTVQAMVFRFRPAINFVTVRADQFDPNRRGNLDLVLINPQVADLGVVKTVDNPAPNVGDTVTFTITLGNAGPDAATNVLVTDLLPAGLQFVGATPSQGTYDPATGIWTVGTVANGASVTLQIQALVVAPGVTTNTATGDGDPFDPDPGDNTGIVTVTPQQADLSVVKTVDNPAPNVGDTVTFTITLGNAGPNAATNVIVTDLLPAGLQFVGATPSQGTYDPATGVWTVGTLASGASVTLQIQALVVAPGATTNTATGDGDQFDPDPGDNTGIVTVRSGTADLILDKQVSDPAPAVFEVVTFTYTLRNQGPDAATDVVVSDPFPPGLEFVAVVSVDQGTYDPATGLWQVGTLPAGSVVTLRISARVTAVGTVVNQATASGAEFDPDLSNNRSTATQTVPPPDPSKRNLLASSPTIPVVSAPARVEDLSIEGFGVPGRVAVGAGAGDRPLVRVFDQATGAERFRFYAYDPSFTGGVAVAVGDVDGDGVDDIITGAGAGGGPHVKVFSGRDGTVLASFFAYDPSFAGGVVVAAADVNGDGVADIVTGAGPGGGPHVKVFDGRAGAEILNFFAYSADFRGGVSVAVGDLNGDGTADIITGAGAGGGPHVKVFDGSTGTERLSFFAYEAAFLGGVFVGATGPAGGPADIVTGPGLGGGPVVKRFNGRDGTEQAAVLATGMSGTAGARVAGANLTGVGAGDVLVGAGPGQDARLVLLGDLALDGIDEVLALNSNYQGGLFVAGSR